MPLTKAFWIIVDGTIPTAFRSPNREELLPTLHQLQRTQPTVALVWFERGRIWATQEEAREDQDRRRRLARERKDSWRPGGSHVDPHAKYKITRDEKRARFKKRATFERQRAEGDAPPPPRRDRPFGDKPFRDKPFRDKPFSDRPGGDRPFARKPFGAKPFGAKPYGRKPFGGPPRSSDRSEGSRGSGEERPWRPKKPGGFAPRSGPKGPWKPRGPRGPGGPGGPKGGGRKS